MEKKRFPATYVEVPDVVAEQPHRVGFYLATEEFIARHLPAGNYLYSWVLPEPVAMIGRNQVLHQEVNIDFCRRNGVHLLRRKSGGGTIYGDEKNVFWSLITDEGTVEEIFAQYTHAVADALTRIGVEAKVSGRNDILLADGTKVCGNAYYLLGNRNVVHGTMLYDADLEKLLGALTPDAEKLKSAGVQSIRSRVGFLKDYLPYGIPRLRDELRNILCNDTIRLDTEDLTEIEKIEALYYHPEHLQGRIVNEGELRSQRIEGCGRIDMRFVLRGSLIKEVQITGDFFEQSDAREAFGNALCGVLFAKDEIRNALERHHPETSIRGLTFDALCGLLEL